MQTGALQCALQHKRERFCSIVVAHPTTELMIVSDEEGRILDLNETAAERLGKPAEELVDLSLHDLASPGAASTGSHGIRVSACANGCRHWGAGPRGG